MNRLQLKSQGEPDEENTRARQGVKEQLALFVVSVGIIRARTYVLSFSAHARALAPVQCQSV